MKRRVNDDGIYGAGELLRDIIRALHRFDRAQERARNRSSQSLDVMPRAWSDEVRRKAKASVLKTAADICDAKESS